MTQPRMDGFGEAIRAAGLSTDSVIVIGSGILDKLGIREAHDIDLVVDEEAFASFDSRPDLVRHENALGVSYHTENDAIELWRTWGLLGEVERTYGDLLPNTIVYDGVRYMTLAYVKQWKQKKGRDKDLRDVTLIEQYEAKHD